MRGAANWLLFSAAFIWFLFAFEEGSMITAFHTQEGCNATLLCNQPGNVTWLNSAGQEIEGPRFTTLAYGPFSTLEITVVSKNDRGNITCLGEERNLTINIEVCSDKRESQFCLTEITNRPQLACNDSFMIRECKKSCELCPDCQETVLPTLPPSTGNIQTSLVSHTDISMKPRTESVSSPSTQDLGLRSSGASWSSGFQTLFALFFGLFSILGAFFQNLNNVQTWKFTRPRAVARRKQSRGVSLPKHNYLKKLLHNLFHR